MPMRTKSWSSTTNTRIKTTTPKDLPLVYSNFQHMLANHAAYTTIFYLHEGALGVFLATLHRDHLTAAQSRQYLHPNDG